jgi:Family of unknown function (DUF6519)/IPT/TIG domain
MPVITTSTFDPLKGRCNVRLQQGVPLVDADWNELDDIHKFELRSYLRWFVGDGIPDGVDAFKIDTVNPPVVDDFIIRAGGQAPLPGTSNYERAIHCAGRAVVDGLGIIITTDINYKAQPLFSNAVGLGVPLIAPLPPASGKFAVYLDVWEHLVTAQQDPSLVLSGIGTESCARVKREWCVRTRLGTTAPQAIDPDFIADHSYYLLAIIARSNVNDPLVPASVEDRRHVRLSLTSVEQRLAAMEALLLMPKFLPPPNEFNPKFGVVGSNVNVQLFGVNLNVGNVAVQFNGIPAQIMRASSTSSQIVSTLPASVGPGDVKITITTSGGTATSQDSFKVLAQPAPQFALDSSNQFNPMQGDAGTSVTLLGNNFNIDPVTVRFGNFQAQVVNTTANMIVTKVPAMPSGPVQITVQTGAGSVQSANPFTVV